MHQVTKSLNNGAERNAALILIKLTGDEVTLSMNDGVLDFLNQFSFTDARVSRDDQPRGMAQEGQFKGL